MDIALCHQGENYSGVLVAIRSAVANCSDPQRLHFHVHSDLNDQSRDYIISSSGANVSFYPLNFNYFGSIKFAYPPIYYYRILLPEIHSSIERLLYIDTDIICERNLLDLKQFDKVLEELVGLGVLDNDNARVGRELDIPFYVNTGFLYLNLARARSIKFTEKVLHRCDGNFYTDIGHDQRGLNQVFSGTEILPRLDQTWNLQLPVPESLDVLPRGARVLHITGPFKPWTYTCALIWWEAFRAYLPEDWAIPRKMPTNAVGCVFAGNMAAREGRDSFRPPVFPFGGRAGESKQKPR